MRAFTKMHGTGNDFVVLDAHRTSPPALLNMLQTTQALCQRRWGVGSDGLLLLDKPDDGARAAGASVRMRMWNPDGSEDMCGNGLRCVAKLAAVRGYVGQNFIVQTLAGLRACEVLANGQVRVAMGHPSFVPQEVPMLLPHGLETTIEYSLPVGETILAHVTTLSTGSTHTVVFIDREIADDDFQTLSPLIENHPWFPERTSVMWAQVLNRSELKLRIWERGVQEASGTTGETLACGTGACAAAVAAQITGRCDQEVRVHSRGGSLTIGWHQGEEIRMTGAATIVYEGVWNG